MFLFCFFLSYIYWTDWGNDAKIERAALNGQDRQAIVSNPHVVWPNGLVIDHSTEKIYWCDGRLRTISSANLDGSGTEVSFEMLKFQVIQTFSFAFK